MHLTKKVFDFFFAAFALLILSPLILLLGFLVWIILGWPVIFSQKRPGYRNRPFHIYKFRTMKELRDPAGNYLPDECRMTGFGRFLRSSSLDELPELINVIKGEMSIVGPRPLLMQYLDRYSPYQIRRHEVYPGITGWTQINGRNALSWEEKLDMDVWYVEHWSFWLDIKIILITFWKVIKREGISQPGHVTAEEFMGSQAHKSS